MSEALGDRVYFGGHANNTPLPWNPMPYMDEYLYELANGEKPRAVNYLRPVKVGLSHFATFMATVDIVHPDEVRREHLIRFQAHLSRLRTKNDTTFTLRYRQQLATYVHGWFNWMLRLDYIVGDPWTKVRIGRVPKEPKPLEDSEIDDLFDAHRSQAFSIPPFAFHRREVILVLLYGWGLRIHELQALNTAQMSVAVDWVTVRNKGGGTKPLPYGPELKQVVQRWLPKRAQHAVYDEDALIIDQSGHRLSLARIREIVTDCGSRAGLTINPHRLRDSFGTTMLDGDVPIERIMKLMGHRKREQTLSYSRLNDPKLRESYDAVMGPQLTRLMSYGPKIVPDVAASAPRPMVDGDLRRVIKLALSLYPNASQVINWDELLFQIETKLALELPDNMNDPMIQQIQSGVRRARRRASTGGN